MPKQAGNEAENALLKTAPRTVASLMQAPRALITKLAGMPPGWQGRTRTARTTRPKARSATWWWRRAASPHLKSLTYTAAQGIGYTESPRERSTVRFPPRHRVSRKDNRLCYHIFVTMFCDALALETYPKTHSALKR